MKFLSNIALLLLGYIGTNAQLFNSVDLIPAPLIEWDQQPYTYYTGQSINITWSSTGFQASDLVKITYPGVNLRTLTTGSGTLITDGSYKVRLSDSTNMPAVSVPVTLALSTNAAIFNVSSQTISVINSRLLAIVPQDGTRILGSGQNTVCDNRNLTVSWRGLGEAQFGTATVSLTRQGGFGGASTLATQSNIPISGNTTITLVCPRSVTPSTFSPYAFTISVQEPGGAAYTGTSSSFSVAIAATPTPTPSITPTQTPTPSPTASTTPSPSRTPSQTPTPSSSTTSSATSSQTPTMTPSTTATAAASIDYVGIARAAADQVDTTTPAIAGALGGIGGILIVIGTIQYIQKRQLTQKRMKRLGMTSRRVQEMDEKYGADRGGIRENNSISMQPQIVMYSVQSIPQTQTNSKAFDSYKKAFPPRSTGESK
jgi:hypothetical protein